MLCTFNTQCLLVACQSVRHGTLAQEMHNHLVHWLASSATTPAELVLLLSRPTLILQFTEHSARAVRVWLCVGFQQGGKHVKETRVCT